MILIQVHVVFVCALFPQLKRSVFQSLLLSPHYLFRSHSDPIRRRSPRATSRLSTRVPTPSPIDRVAPIGILGERYQGEELLNSQFSQ